MQIAEMFAILDSFYTNITIGVEVRGGGKPQYGRFSYLYKLNTASFKTHLSFRYHKIIVANSMMASYVVVSSWVDTCPVTLLPFEDHPST